MKSYRLIKAAILALLPFHACGTAVTPRTTQINQTPADVIPRPGSYQTISTSDPEVIRAAEFAVKVINQRSNSLYPYQLEKILAARSQVVAGVNYALTLALSRKSRQEVHEVVVFSQPWSDTMRLTADKIKQ